MSLNEQAIKNALQHANRLWEWAKKRKHLQWPEKVAVVMKEFYRWTLHSWSWEIVKNPEQAKAIAMDEAWLSKNKTKK